MQISTLACSCSVEGQQWGTHETKRSHLQRRKKKADGKWEALKFVEQRDGEHFVFSELKFCPRDMAKLNSCPELAVWYSLKCTRRIWKKYIYFTQFEMESWFSDGPDSRRHCEKQTFIRKKHCGLKTLEHAEHGGLYRRFFRDLKGDFLNMSFFVIQLIPDA